MSSSSGETEAVVKADGLGAAYPVRGLEDLGQVKRVGTGFSHYYYLKDHLGSVKMTVHSSGLVSGYDDYYSYGQQMEGRCLASSADPRFKYTG